MITEATKKICFSVNQYIRNMLFDLLFYRYDNDKLNQAEKDALTVGQTPGCPIKHLSLIMTSCSLRESKHHSISNHLDFL